MDQDIHFGLGWKAISIDEALQDEQNVNLLVCMSVLISWIHFQQKVKSTFTEATAQCVFQLRFIQAFCVGWNDNWWEHQDAFSQVLSMAGLSFRVGTSVAACQEVSSHLCWQWGMSFPSWQWHRTGSCWSPVPTLPVAPLWCDLRFVPNSRGNKAAVNLSPEANFHLGRSEQPKQCSEYTIVSSILTYLLFRSNHRRGTSLSDLTLNLQCSQAPATHFKKFQNQHNKIITYNKYF